LFSSIALLVASLASRRAVAAAVVVGVFLVSTPVAGVLAAVGGRTLREIAPMASPISLVQGVKVALYRPTDGFDIGNFGPMYVSVALAVVVACVTLLLARYRKVGA
jgi:ABC-2 type transport system permease protein